VKTRFQQYEIKPPDAVGLIVQISEMTPGGTAMVGLRYADSTKWKTSGYPTWEDAIELWGQR
jgi:transcription elongation GreA/GreB family factor